ncbi:hypothetical protein EVAR_19212_1 [Eumeta japonica]|uniref:Uncharacterized protein n=1 Tax=Eumeta variegata TaxID=151549 RepID=A0A4C1VEP5_EUMVA|nr:hypothetical protein EVAR_19212_1 [Eumeta japonica]
MVTWSLRGSAGTRWRFLLGYRPRPRITLNAVVGGGGSVNKSLQTRTLTGSKGIVIRGQEITGELTIELNSAC